MGGRRESCGVLPLCLVSRRMRTLKSLSLLGGVRRFITLAEHQPPTSASTAAEATASGSSNLRQPALPPLVLANCSLVVPPTELELLRGLLGEAGRLPQQLGSSISSSRREALSDSVTAPGSGGSSSSSSSSDSNSSSTNTTNTAGARPYPLVSWPPGIDPRNSSRLLGVADCPRGVLLAYAAVAEVESEGPDSISFKQIAFMGW